MLGLIGQKIGMTQIFDDQGNVIPVTILQGGPCVITQIKTNEKDGYQALQLGFKEKKKNRLKKAEIGHFKPLKDKNPLYLKEFRIDDIASYEVGQMLDATIFEEDNALDIIGTTKGKGFQGVFRKYGFRGGRKTHGSNFHRRPGAVGQCADPAKIWKNKKMPGRMGNIRKTIKKLSVINIIKEDNLILVKGSVPGINKGLVYINKAK